MASQIFVVSPLDGGKGPLLHTIPMGFSEAKTTFRKTGKGQSSRENQRSRREDTSSSGENGKEV
jgi:hypothetical protein